MQPDQERKPIAPAMQACGVDGCGIPLGTTSGCPQHGTRFRFGDGGIPSGVGDNGALFRLNPSTFNRPLATWHPCHCYTESIGQGKRYYPCEKHEASFDAILKGDA